MRKIFLLPVILTLVQYIFSQNDSNYLTLGLYINPNIMYRTAWIKPGYEGDFDYKKYLKDNFPIFGYDYGISITWKRFQIGDIETGMFLSQRGYGWGHKIEVPDSIANFQFDPGFLYPEEFKNRRICNFLDIPVSLRRDILKGDGISLYGKAGVSLNVLLNEKELTHVYYIDDTEADYKYSSNLMELRERNSRLVNFSTLISFGLNVSLSKNINIQAEAIMNYSILPVSKGGDVSTRLFETGIKTGISYKF